MMSIRSLLSYFTPLFAEGRMSFWSSHFQSSLPIATLPASSKSVMVLSSPPPRPSLPTVEILDENTKEWRPLRPLLDHDERLLHTLFRQVERAQALAVATISSSSASPRRFPDRQVSLSTVPERHVVTSNPWDRFNGGGEDRLFLDDYEQPAQNNAKSEEFVLVAHISHKMASPPALREVLSKSPVPQEEEDFFAMGSSGIRKRHCCAADVRNPVDLPKAPLAPVQVNSSKPAGYDKVLQLAYSLLRSPKVTHQMLAMSAGAIPQMESEELSAFQQQLEEALAEWEGPKAPVKDERVMQAKSTSQAQVHPSQPQNQAADLPKSFPDAMDVELPVQPEKIHQDKENQSKKNVSHVSFADPVNVSSPVFLHPQWPEEARGGEDVSDVSSEGAIETDENVLLFSRKGYTDAFFQVYRGASYALILLSFLIIPVILVLIYSCAAALWENMTIAALERQLEEKEDAFIRARKSVTGPLSDVAPTSEYAMAANNWVAEIESLFSPARTDKAAVDRLMRRAEEQSLDGEAHSLLAKDAYYALLSAPQRL